MYFNKPTKDSLYAWLWMSSMPTDHLCTSIHCACTHACTYIYTHTHFLLEYTYKGFVVCVTAKEAYANGPSMYVRILRMHTCMYMNNTFYFSIYLQRVRRVRDWGGCVCQTTVLSLNDEHQSCKRQKPGDEDVRNMYICIVHMCACICTEILQMPAHDSAL